MSVDPATVAVGDRVPEWRREGTFRHWNRFASVTYAFSDHHMDDEAGRHEGFPSAFIMAPLSHAYLHAMLREWLEDRGRIVTIDMRLKNPLLRGRTLIAGGDVTAVRREGDEVVVELDIWQVDDQGTQLGTGTAVVALDAG